MSGTEGGRKHLLHKERKTHKNGNVKNEIKEKPQPFMLLQPLYMATHEFTAVERRLGVVLS